MTKLADLAIVVERELNAQDHTASKGTATYDIDGFRLVVENITAQSYHAVKLAVRVRHADWSKTFSRPGAAEELSAAISKDEEIDL